MSFIFISYSRKDQTYVDRLVQALTQRNLPVWLDNEINHGQAWNRVIREQLDQCQVFLLVMSPRAEQSPWVRNEMLYAINKRKVIFPLLLEGEHWFDVLSWQGADVTDGSLPQERFFEDVGSHFPNAGTTAESLPVQTVVEEKIPPAPATPVRTAKQPTPATQAVELKSEKGIDYTKLQNLLKARKWKAADEETAHCISEVGLQEEDLLLDRKLLRFPCVDLLTIDRLWVKYSNGRFGFSVQKRIYFECGGKPEGKSWYKFWRTNDEIESWGKLGDRVGWREDGKWIDYADITFKTSAPRGHLPTLRVFGWDRGVNVGVMVALCVSPLASRLVNCDSDFRI